MKKLLPVVAYIRMSTPKQKMSPARQKEELKKLAKRRGLQIIRWYEDKGITGNSLSLRPEFRRMIEDITERGDFAAILCWKQSRFGRFDSTDSGAVTGPMKQHQVKLITPERTYNFANRMDRLMFIIQAEDDNNYLFNIASETNSGNKFAAEQGFGIKQPAYGYDRVYYDRKQKEVYRVPFGQTFRKPPNSGWYMKYEINAAQAAVVRRIYHQYIELGYGYGRIARLLNQDRLEDPTLDSPFKGRVTNRKQGAVVNSGEWGQNTIKRILENPRYVGDNVAGEFTNAQYSSLLGGHLEQGGKKTKNDLPKVCKTPEQLIVADAHAQIIDRHTWARAQEIREQRAKARKPVRDRGGEYLLSSGLLVCGSCGGYMHGGGSRGNGKNERYVCSTAKQAGRCRHYTVPKAQLENFVLKKVRERLFDPKVLADLQTEIRKTAEQRPDMKKQRRAAQAALDALEEKIRNARVTWSAEEDPDMKEEARMALEELRGQRRKAEQKLELLSDTYQGTTPERRNRAIMERVEQLARDSTSHSPDRLRHFLQETIEEVRLNFDWNRPRGDRLVDGEIRFREPMMNLLDRGRMRTRSSATCATAVCTKASGAT